MSAHVTVSVGAALRNASHRTPQDLIRAADDALYRAKKAGRKVAKKGARKTAKKAGRKPAAKGAAAAKYRDEAGNTWGGRGPRPAWLRTALAAGKQMSDFAVK